MEALHPDALAVLFPSWGSRDLLGRCHEGLWGLGTESREGHIRKAKQRENLKGERIAKRNCRSKLPLSTPFHSASSMNK